jgi:predicted DCC family thiol-disulfide oxidoreductase YuxK
MRTLPPFGESVLATTSPHIVLYDGTCGFCHASVQWLLAHDPTALFAYAPLQGETAARLRERHPELPTDLDSVLLVEKVDTDHERVWWRSHAVFRICGYVGGIWAVPGLLRFLPRFFTDALYMAVAKVRHRLAGTRDACSLPSEDEARRFLP